jgi:hypothetical protein
VKVCCRSYLCASCDGSPFSCSAFSCLHGRAEAPSASNQQGASSKDNTAANAHELKVSIEAQEAAAVAIDEVIEFAKKAGDQNTMAIWQARKGQPFTIGDVRGLLDVMERLRDDSELQSAQQSYTQLRIVADSLRENFPPLNLLVQLHLSGVDDAFERYDVALHRIDDVESIIQKLGDKLPPYESFALYQIPDTCTMNSAGTTKRRDILCRLYERRTSIPPRFRKI